MAKKVTLDAILAAILDVERKNNSIACLQTIQDWFLRYYFGKVFDVKPLKFFTYQAYEPSYIQSYVRKVKTTFDLGQVVGSSYNGTCYVGEMTGENDGTPSLAMYFDD